jgi:hypothetical protein
MKKSKPFVSIVTPMGNKVTPCMFAYSTGCRLYESGVPTGQCGHNAMHAQYSFKLLRRIDDC